MKPRNKSEWLRACIIWWLRHHGIVGPYTSPSIAALARKLGEAPEVVERELRELERGGALTSYRVYDRDGFLEVVGYSLTMRWRDHSADREAGGGLDPPDGWWEGVPKPGGKWPGDAVTDAD